MNTFDSSESLEGRSKVNATVRVDCSLFSNKLHLIPEIKEKHIEVSYFLLNVTIMSLVFYVVHAYEHYMTIYDLYASASLPL